MSSIEEKRREAAAEIVALRGPDGESWEAAGRLERLLDELASAIDQARARLGA